MVNRRCLNAVSKKQWENYCNHVGKVEDNMWQAFNIQDDIIRLTESSQDAGEDVLYKSSDLFGVVPIGVN